MRFKYRALIRKGRMVIVDHALLEKDLAKMKEEERFYLIIERPKDGRTVSDPMRRYYYGVVMRYISEETGHTADLIHDQMKRQILGSRFDKYGFEILPSVFSNQSTLDLATKKHFIEEVRRWAYDFLNIAIPDPESVIV